MIYRTKVMGNSRNISYETNSLTIVPLFLLMNEQLLFYVTVSYFFMTVANFTSQYYFGGRSAKLLTAPGKNNVYTNIIVLKNAVTNI